MIHGLANQMAVLGHIKIGGRKKITVAGGGERLIPTKDDHFTVTTSFMGDESYVVDVSLMNKLTHYGRDVDEHGQLVDEHIRRMLVMLPFDDPNENLITTLAVYDGTGVRCRGDGQKAEYIDPKTGKTSSVYCPCEMFQSSLAPGDDPRIRAAHQINGMSPNIKHGFVCKAHGILRLMICEAKTLGGVHIFRTTSINSIKQLFASMAHIQLMTGGPLSYIPLEFEVSPRRVKAPHMENPQTVYIVRLTYKAEIMEFLKEVANGMALRAQMQKQIASKSFSSLPLPGKETAIEQRAIAEEFHNSADYPMDSNVVSDMQEDREISDTPIRTNLRVVQTEQIPQEPASKSTTTPEAPPPETAQETRTETPVETPTETPTQTEPVSEATTQPLTDTPPPSFPVFSAVQTETDDISPADKSLRKLFLSTGQTAGLSNEFMRAWIKEAWSVDSTAALKTWQVQRMIDALASTLSRT